jgi:MFS family permease
MEQDSIKRDLTHSFYDGIFANMFATLTGGVFLTGFALFLGMNDFMIGLLAALPFLVTIFQLPASYLIEKSGRRKAIAIGAAAAARLIWIPIVIFGVIPFLPRPAASFFVLGLIFFSYAFVTASYVSWLAWTSDLVPEGMWGRFFGTRNMLCGAAGMVVMVVFGNFLDFFKDRGPEWLPLGFGITFVSAVFFGVVSLRFLRRISEPKIHHVYLPRSFRTQMWRTLQEANFRRFLTFAFVWSFSVYFAAPFFTLYFLRELRFSYGFVAILGMLSAFADLTGMRLWGRISDKIKNKAVIQFASWAAAFLPLAWVMVRPEDIVIPILLQLIGGGFWAGINLCTNNLLLRIAPQRNRSLYLSVYNIAGGLGAAAGPLVAGTILIAIGDLNLHLSSYRIFPLHYIFLISTLLRLASRLLLNAVREPEEATVGELVRILRSVRGLTMVNGFNYLLHPFIEIAKKGRTIR